MSLANRINTTLLIKLIAAATTYGFAILLARVMSVEAFGQVAFFLNTALLLSVVGSCGQQMALIRFIPTLKNRAAKGAVINVAFRLTITGTLIVFLSAVAAGFLARSACFMTDYTPAILIAGFALILAVGWADFQGHLARSLHLIPLALIPKEVLWRGGAALIIAAAFARTGQLPVVHVLMIMLTTLVVLTVVQKMTLGVQGVRSVRSSPPANWRSSIGPFWLTSVSNIFLANADVVVVGLVFGPRSAGIYFAANRLALLLAFFLTSMNVVIAPVIADIWQNGNVGKVSQLVHDATLRTSIPTLCFGAVLFIFAPIALQIFGPEFTASATALRLLIVAGVVRAVAGPSDILLNMCGFEQAAMHVSAVSLLMSMLLLGLGAWSGEVNGIALAVLVGTLFRKGLFGVIVWRMMSVRTDMFACLQQRRKLVDIQG